VFSIQVFYFSFLRFFLSLLGLLFRVLLYVGAELGLPMTASVRRLRYASGRDTHSSGDTTFHSIVFSSYGLRQAGHRAFKFVLILLKQNWHICSTKSDSDYGAFHPSRPGHLTWYPQGQGRKFLSDRSNSSTQRGLTDKSLANLQNRQLAEAIYRICIAYQVSSSSSMKLSWGAISVEKEAGKARRRGLSLKLLIKGWGLKGEGEKRARGSRPACRYEYFCGRVREGYLRGGQLFLAERDDEY
jgi:hypothetical protein